MTSCRTNTLPFVGRSKRPHSPSPGSDETSKRRQKYIKSLPSGPPSSQVVPTMFTKLQGNAKDGNPKFYCNRPSWASSIPVTLLHLIFGEFVDDCEIYKPTEVDNAFVLDLSTNMSEIYDTEAERAKVFCNLLYQYYRIQLYPADVPGTSYRTDGHASIGP